MVVLVHGGRHDGWCWHLVQTELDRLGLTSVAPDLEATSLDGDVCAVRGILDQAGSAGHAVFLVGHSRAGRILSAAASGATCVRGLIYVTAMLLEEDELNPPGHRPRSAAEINGQADPQLLHEQMYHDVPGDLYAQAVAHLRPVTPQALAHGPQPTPAAWRSVHTTYVVCTDDRYVDPAVQRAMARHADRVVEVASSHAPFLSRPAELAEIIAWQVRERPCKPPPGDRPQSPRRCP